MSETIYLDTSIIGYLTVRPSNNLIVMANLEITRRWWNNDRHNFTLYISQIVLDEVARGDVEKANERLAIVKDFNLLEINDSVEDLATQFLKESNLPPHASDDALHISAATVYGVDYLLTWNCKHIANAHIQKKASPN